MIVTGFQNFCIDWSNSGELLAVAGKVCELPLQALHSFKYVNEVKLYNTQGILLYRTKVPSEHVSCSTCQGPSIRQYYL